MKSVALFLILANSALAADWYVRPGVFSSLDANGHPIPTASVYGIQNGTSYSNAWNCITSIVWGGSGVQSGDTIWVCGTHIYKLPVWTSNWPSQAVSVIGVSGVTIRMDYPGDSGLVFGGAFDLYHCASAYSGPDSNGVYRQTIANGGSSDKAPMFEVTSTAISRLPQKTNATWTDGAGQFCAFPNNYVKRSDGLPPTQTNIAVQYYGWAFDLNRQSNITFQSCNFIAASPSAWAFGAIRNPKPVYTNNYAGSTHITFTNCIVHDGQQFTLYPGEDDWGFYGCTISNQTSGIYAIFDGQNRAANRITVTVCTITDMGSVEWTDPDSHAVGIQGSSWSSVTRNRFERTGTSVELWTAGVPMTNNIIAYNSIKDIGVRATTSGHGIAISGDNAGTPPGKRTGIEIYGNLIVNVGIGGTQTYQGSGINSNNRDSMRVYNNTIVGGREGIKFDVVSFPALGEIFNNVIVGPTNHYIWCNGTTCGVTFTNNLFFPMLVADLAHGTNFFITIPATNRGTGNVCSDPKFISNVNFSLQSTSPAIDAGVASDGYTQDILGTSIRNITDIGAFEYANKLINPPKNLHIVQ